MKRKALSLFGGFLVLAGALLLTRQPGANAFDRQEVGTPATDDEAPTDPIRKKIFRPTLPPPIPLASLTFTCGNGKKYTLQAGGDSGGTCEVLTDSNNNVMGAQCGGTSGNYSVASCAIGCSQTGGNGSCSPVN